MSDPSAHPQHPEPPFADRPLDISYEEFTVSNVPSVHPQELQRRLVLKIARFGMDDDIKAAAAEAARLLTGEDRTSI